MCYTCDEWQTALRYVVRMTLAWRLQDARPMPVQAPCHTTGSGMQEACHTTGSGRSWHGACYSKNCAEKHAWHRICNLQAPCHPLFETWHGNCLAPLITNQFFEKFKLPATDLLCDIDRECVTLKIPKGCAGAGFPNVRQNPSDVWRDLFSIST